MLPAFLIANMYVTSGINYSRTKANPCSQSSGVVLLAVSFCQTVQNFGRRDETMLLLLLSEYVFVNEKAQSIFNNLRYWLENEVGTANQKRPKISVFTNKNPRRRHDDVVTDSCVPDRVSPSSIGFWPIQVDYVFFVVVKNMMCTCFREY